MSMAGFKFDIDEFDATLMQALRKTYSENQSFASEAAFKYELFHQLHGLKVGGSKLGTKPPSASTCMLHAEAKPINGLRGQRKFVDIVVCDPTIENRYNCRTEVAIELKLSLSARELDGELEKFASYNGKVPRLYGISGNHPRIGSRAAMEVASKFQKSGTIIGVLTRDDFPDIRAKTANFMSVDGNESRLAERVADCVRDTLKLYGENSKDAYHSFFWRNYEDEEERGWTFPCEGDFTAQLYHLLRSRLKQCAVLPEYRSPSEPSRSVDLFVDGGDESVGIEIKMNYDNFKGRGEDEETAKISRKFKAMSKDHGKHLNILVVIQGEHAYAGHNKANAHAGLRTHGAKFSLMSYAERRKEACGPEAFR